MNGLFHDITRRMFMVFISARIMSLLLRRILFFFLWDGPFSFLLLFESWAWIRGMEILDFNSWQDQ